MKRFDSLYIHVPFCARKCGYCAFYSVPDATGESRQLYLQQLTAQLRAARDRLQTVETIFIGGGTPSALTASELTTLLDAIRTAVRPEVIWEWSVEANPESMTLEKAKILAVHGVNRVSLGVQSFDPHLRAVLGRGGDCHHLEPAMDAVLTVGIRNLGVDLIYGIPGQDLEAWQRDLRRALAWPITHLSTYALTLEEGTAMAGADHLLADDDLQVAMWDVVEAATGPTAFRRYEVSNLAKPGFGCRHNLLAWHGGTYLGLGPAAASFDGETRWAQPADLTAWLAGEEPVEDRLPPALRAAEILAFGLRTTAGWNREAFLTHTGFDFRELRGAALDALIDEGLLQWDHDHLMPTRRGLLFHDHVAASLL